MSNKTYEWAIKSKKGFTIRQGVVQATTKKEVEKYLSKSFNDEERELVLDNKLYINLIGD